MGIRSAMSWPNKMSTRPPNMLISKSVRYGQRSLILAQSTIGTGLVTVGKVDPEIISHSPDDVHSASSTRSDRNCRWTSATMRFCWWLWRPNRRIKPSQMKVVSLPLSSMTLTGVVLPQWSRTCRQMVPKATRWGPARARAATALQIGLAPCSIRWWRDVQSCTPHAAVDRHVSAVRLGPKQISHKWRLQMKSPLVAICWTPGNCTKDTVPRIWNKAGFVMLQPSCLQKSCWSHQLLG